MCSDKNMEVSFSSNSASSKASSSESTASSVNCVTVSDTEVSVPTRKKTKLSYMHLVMQLRDNPETIPI